MAEELKERKIMTKTVKIATSKAGNVYMYVMGKDGKTRYFVNLVKDNKAYIPSYPKGAKEVDINFTSYEYNDIDHRLVLFNVSDLVFKG